MPSTDEKLSRRRAALEQRDVAQRAVVAAYGVDPARRRIIDLTFWAPTREAAEQLAAAVVRNDMPAPRLSGPVDAGRGLTRWMACTSIMCSVDFITTRENLMTFLLFADQYDCEHDGWGTAIVEATQPGWKPA